MKAESRHGVNSDNELVYWLALEDKTNLITAREAASIFSQFGTLEPLFHPPYGHSGDLGIDVQRIRNVTAHVNRVSLEKTEQMLRHVKSRNLRIITYVDPDYPRLLRSTSDPPLFILHRGQSLAFDECIAVAGTREASWYGRMMARKIGKFLASKGFTIVSGLARGIDEWAHCGALEIPGAKTIAVLAWMDPIYPSEHRQLAEDIARRGGIISERLMNPNDRSAASKFVRRNRITSGISHCVIAIESGNEGGTVHQIRIALDQKRKVFALKPRRNNERAAKGFELFVDMGVTPFTSIRDLSNRLREKLPGKEKKLDTFSQHSLERF